MLGYGGWAIESFTGRLMTLVLVARHRLRRRSALRLGATGIAILGKLGVRGVMTWRGIVSIMLKSEQAGVQRRRGIWTEACERGQHYCTKTMDATPTRRAWHACWRPRPSLVAPSRCAPTKACHGRQAYGKPRAVGIPGEAHGPWLHRRISRLGHHSPSLNCLNVFLCCLRMVGLWMKSTPKEWGWVVVYQTRRSRRSSR